MAKTKPELTSKAFMVAFSSIKFLLFFNPRPLWNVNQPIIHPFLHPMQTSNMNHKILPFFADKKGICIGGSLRWKFNEFLGQAKQVVNVDAFPYFLGKPTNADYITDATNLFFAKDEEFDFVCSSHVIEHLANPIKALKEWMRTIKKDCIIYCGVPDKRFTFDHRRQRTSLSHLIEDYRSDIGSWDSTHVCDIIRNTDLRMDYLNLKPELFFKRYLQYIESKDNATLQPHHHVYTKEDVIALFRYAGLEIVFAELIADTIHVVGRKIAIK